MARRSTIARRAPNGLWLDLKGKRKNSKAVSIQPGRPQSSKHVVYCVTFAFIVALIGVMSSFLHSSKYLSILSFLTFIGCGQASLEDHEHSSSDELRVRSLSGRTLNSSPLLATTVTALLRLCHGRSFGVQIRSASVLFEIESRQ